ncbi:MAG TPA: ATP-dependent helicase [Leptolyngbyaceae cyanobacterium M33_DOE_097]|uniref:DNA 3'-5' helicase n=1 Tax=Oscillatoriales cyanobacterium SpSt-418 TaxID=2282169 RepID=A0A7C3PG32_9CYAN|nr:ATP-dependent helicase [Leptolyngbyaceae cyanobacterium M33_DOE_097]
MPLTTALESKLQELRDRLRPGQRELADWRGGTLAVSAVPGAGKSTGMAIAAAMAIARNQLNARCYLVIVTFTRSAAANIKGKIRATLRELGLPATGFMVNTLHGLAWAIARAHPDQFGVNPDATLITPSRSHRLIRTAVEQWIAANPKHYQRLLEGQQFDGEETERLRRQSVLRTEVLPELAMTIIREAKSSGLQPDDLRQISNQIPDDYGALEIAAGLYEFYQAQLAQRNLIDYDEMILAALRVLEDPAIRQHWQNQVFAVFEDEAQDSSPLQTRLLEILAANPNQPNDLRQMNLVRVGDPNQAINSTFTPADPIYFREFCQQCEQQDRLATMTQAGRSSDRIIAAANFTLELINQRWGKQQGDRPFRRQLIEPVAITDPQPNANPLALGKGVELYTPDDIYQTVESIGQRAIELFQQHPESNAAVLVRENKQGEFVARELRRLYPDQLRVYEVGQRDRQSHVPADMLTLLNFVDRPHSPDYLKAALTTLAERHRIPTQDLNALVPFPEQFLYPGLLDPPQSEAVAQARRFCTSLLRARLELPSTQLIPFLALALNYDQNELATADKLSDRIAQQAQGDQALPTTLRILSEIVATEQFDPIDTDNPEERYTRSGQLTIITMHKAKGLDWDAVFIPFLIENSIPGSQWIPPQWQFLGTFTLAEIARAQVRSHLHQKLPPATAAIAWEAAKNLKTAEEFRLLYVAMTRAKRLLWMAAEQQAPFTWNKPNNLEARSPCPVFPPLQQAFV